MKYWITIQGTLPREVAYKLWNRIEWTKTNLTVLFDKAYIYGDNDENTIEMIVKEAEQTGYEVERR